MLVKDSPGFLVNRVLVPYLHEAVLLVGEGMRVDWVDRAMRRFGMAAGPLEVLDQVGLDVAAHIAQNLQSVFADRLPPNPAFDLMKENGWLGQKSGLGFYRWQRGKKQVHVAAQALVAERLQSGGARMVTDGAPDDVMRAASERMVALMVNEAAACLGEKLAADAATIDMALVLGSGWAPHRGGPLRYAQDRGYRTVLLLLEELEKKHGQRFHPCPELERLASA
jgi:3-hydroxyacyl-CoA dehydrogenase/enoyl-CoA hydratase/3-hydroxybutyryl-CoA epimerase